MKKPEIVVEGKEITVFFDDGNSYSVSWSDDDSRMVALDTLMENICMCRLGFVQFDLLKALMNADGP